MLGAPGLSRHGVTMPARAQLSRDDLVAGLQMLVRLQGRKRKTGRATWQFDATGLTIWWGEGEQSIRAAVTEPGLGSVDGDVMRSLAAQLPKDERLEVLADGHRVRLGSLLIDTAGVVTNTSPQLAPDAPDLEVLTLAIRLTREEWRAAGIEERVEGARDRMREAVSTAAAALAPFGIDEQALSRLLVDTIRARSTARGSR
jgi:hypothetical protein